MYHLKPVFQHEYLAKERAINDIKFSKFSKDIFGFSQDNSTVIVDTREG